MGFEPITLLGRLPVRFAFGLGCWPTSRPFIHRLAAYTTKKCGLVLHCIWYANLHGKFLTRFSLSRQTSQEKNAISAFEHFYKYRASVQHGWLRGFNMVGILEDMRILFASNVMVS